MIYEYNEFDNQDDQDDQDLLDADEQDERYFSHRLHCLKLAINTSIKRDGLDIEDWMADQDWRDLTLTTEQLAHDWDEGK